MNNIIMGGPNMKYLLARETEKWEFKTKIPQTFFVWLVF